MTKKGTTLIELLIAIIILGIIMTVFSSIYLIGVNSFRNEFVQSQLLSNSQVIVDRINQDVKFAQGIDETFNSYTTSNTLLIIQSPAIDTEHIFIPNGIDRIIYYQDGEELHRVIYANPNSSRYPQNGIDQILTKNLKTLSFGFFPDQANPNKVSTTLTLSKGVGKLYRSVTITAKAKMRNKL